ncbi:MAG: CBS domain-containing protein [Oligoflexia bacterium]|nr:CBS domain-containing protein [Oligoflexia bacterium]
MECHANEIMTPRIITIKAGDSLCNAHRLMTENRIRHLPVVDDEDPTRIVGILTDLELQRAMKWHPGSPRNCAEGYDVDTDLRVRDLMHTPVLSVDENLSLRDVAETLLREKITGVLVMGPDHHIHGIVTTDDMLKFLLSRLDKDPAGEEWDARDVVDEHFIESIGY